MKILTVLLLAIVLITFATNVFADELDPAKLDHHMEIALL